ncbi:MAG TPA: glycosyltransferase family 2 protein [Candidatus Paceibacterota bacterium]
MLNGKRIIAVLPAYNAARTLKQTVDAIPKNIVDEIIVIDDASTDETVKIAKSLDLKTFVHKKNLGYGGNQKTCYAEALKLGADIAVMVHPDFQYDPKLIPELVTPISINQCDAVFGSRMLLPGKALEGGMPKWKYLANIFLTKLENFVLDLSLSEYHSGFRAYSRRVIETLELEKNSNDFVFDTEIIVQMKIASMKIKEIPISTRYFPEASMIGFAKSIAYGLSILKVLVRYILHGGK